MIDVKYIVGDTHFGWDSMFNRVYSKTFSSMEDYERIFIENYNATVNNECIVIFLGDIGKSDHVAKIIPRLNGHKWLILGNHDKEPKEFYKGLFEEVFEYPIFVNKFVVLSHIPIPVEPGVMNIHGHTHHVKLKSEWHMNVCPEQIGYKPFSFKIIERKMSGMLKPNHHFLEEWYKDIQLTEVREDLILKEDGTIDVLKTKKLKEKLKKEEFIF